jgi:hypothetical protein
MKIYGKLNIFVYLFAGQRSSLANNEGGGDVGSYEFRYKNLLLLMQLLSADYQVSLANGPRCKIVL